MSWLRGHRWLAAGACLALAAPASAEELTFGIDFESEYDDNIRRAPDDSPVHKDDFIFRAKGEIGFKDSDGRFTYSLNYRPSYEVYVNNNTLNADGHRVSGSAQYRIGRFTTGYIRDSFSVVPTIDNENEANVDDGGTGEEEVFLGRSESTRNTLTVGMKRAFGPRWISDVSGSWSIQRYDQDARQESDRYSGTLTNTYTMSDSTKLGFGVVGQVWDFKESGTRNAGGNSGSVQFFGTLQQEFGPRTTLTSQFGPAISFNDRDTITGGGTIEDIPLNPFHPTFTDQLINPTTCPTSDAGNFYVSDRCDVFPREFTEAEIALIRSNTGDVPFAATGSEDDDSQLTFFGNLRLQHKWDRVTGSVGWNRSQQASSGIGSITTVDAVNGTVVWKPDTRWTFTGDVRWSRRESLFDRKVVVQAVTPQGLAFIDPVTLLPVDTFDGLRVTGFESTVIEDELMIDSMTYQARITRKVGRRGQAFLRLEFRDQTSDGDEFRRGAEFERFRATLGFRYDFKPIPIQL